MKIYYRELSDWHKAGQVGNVATYEMKLRAWCMEHLGNKSYETWNTFRPPRSNKWTRAEGIQFFKDEYATAFLLVFK